ncbi:hypothetical protein O1L60_07260 [Streptomyces diastatochromogenes]|nr:hypothetical protein [Streptomyces diastatochromogenes]
MTADGTRLRAHTWSEWLTLDGDGDGDGEGSPTPGRRTWRSWRATPGAAGRPPGRHRRGTATYLSFLPEDPAPLLDRMLAAAGITGVTGQGLPEGSRPAAGARTCSCSTTGPNRRPSRCRRSPRPRGHPPTDLLTGRTLPAGPVVLAPHDAVVLKSRPKPRPKP